MQLPLPIIPRPRLTRADFIAAPGNEQALAFLESWPQWPAPAAVLHGPAASGKSHLVQIWAVRAGATVIAATDLREAPDGAVAI
ncbi:MAG: DNA replication protein, partial [Alphaproteobacteria bacterium]|nr:DNA replication protein [Alphaproteobacteria bacterium]